MNFTVATSELNETLKLLIKAVAVKPATPILSGILITAADNKITLQANNFSVGIISKLPASIEEEGKIAVSGKKFVEICGKLPDLTLTLTNEKDNSVCKIKSGSANFTLPTFNAEDFPEVQTTKETPLCTLSGTKLQNLINKTAFSAATGDDRPIFTGIFFKSENNSLIAVATDTHRMALCKETFTSDGDANISCMIPAKILSLIAPYFSDYPVDITFAKNKICFTFTNYFVSLPLIAGEFPLYEKVIPTKSTTTAKIPVEQFKNVLERISIIAKETEYNTVKLSFESDKNFNEDSPFGDVADLTISAYSPDAGKAQEKITINSEGNDLEISFNLNFLLDVLKVFKTDNIIMKMTGSLAPADIRNEDDENFIYVATPVRTK